MEAIRSRVELLFENNFDGHVWDSIISNDCRYIIFDVREEANRSITYCKLKLSGFALESINANEVTWWSTLDTFDDQLIVSEYQDQKDPNNKKYFRLDDGNRVEVARPNQIILDADLKQPFVFEPESESFKTVSDFLGRELACSCEYLEIDEKIILSYYLRSSNGFERFISVLEDGKELLNVVQDKDMKGFASGSFFVLNSKMFFVKNRNEIFIYSV